MCYNNVRSLKKRGPKNCRSEPKICRRQIKANEEILGEEKTLAEAAVNSEQAIEGSCSKASTSGDVFGFDFDDSTWKTAIQVSCCLPANSSSAILSANTYNSLAAYAKNQAEKAKLAFANFAPVSVAA